MNIKGVAMGTIAFAVSGCQMQPTNVTVAPVSDVLNALKAQLSEIRPSAQIQANGACSDTNGNVTVVASPVKAVVDLKTVVTNGSDITGSANVPVGMSGVILGPSVGVTFSNVATNESILNLGVQHTPPTITDLRTEITNLRKNITDYQTQIKELTPVKDQQSQATIAELKSLIATSQAKMHSDEEALASLGEMGQEHPFFHAPVQLPPGSVAAALNSVVQGILDTSHAAPCFLPQSLDVKQNFEVVNKAQGGFSISLVVVKLAADRFRQDDAIQAVTVTFDLSNGNAPISGNGGGS